MKKFRLAIIFVSLMLPVQGLQADTDEQEQYQNAICAGAAIGSAIGLAATGNLAPMPPGCDQYNTSNPNYHQYQQPARISPSVEDYARRDQQLQRRYDDTLRSLREDNDIGLSSGPEIDDEQRSR